MANGNGLITAGSRVRLRFAADDRLVAFVRRGDPAAFETLYERHSAELLSFCMYLLGSRQDAEDAVQTTFAAAYRALLAHERPVSLRPWLFTIARNDCLSILRKRKPWEELNGEPALRGDPFRELELREEVRHTVAGLLELPERQRAALVLAEMHGLSQAEIGTVLGVRAEQVKAFVYQARSHLISARRARDADCVEIRDELATARGAALLRRRLRGHVRSCAGCRAYADGVARQRNHLGALVPWVPSLWLKTRALEHAIAIRAATDPSYLRGAAVGGSLAGAAAAGGGVNGLLTKVAAGLACLGASACVGASVLGTSIFPGEGHAAPANGAPAPALGHVSASSGGAHTVALASVAAARRERVRSRHLPAGAATGEEVLPAGPGGEATAPGPGDAGAVEVTPGEAPKEPVETGQTHLTPGEQRQQEGEARQRTGSEERQRKLDARQLRIEERRRQFSARPPKPSKRERAQAREEDKEEVGGARGPKKSKQERLREREQRRKEKTP